MSADAQAESSDGRPHGTSARANVIVVFDSPSVRETVSVVDLGEDFEVTVCDSPGAALAEIERTRPHLVAICAATNPGGSLDLCRQIKSSHEGYLPVVVLPVRASAAELVRAYQAEADDCVPITMAPEQVAMRLRSLVRAKALYDRAVVQTTEAESRVRDLAEANLEAADLVMEIEERERRIREQNEELERRAKSLAAANAEAAQLVLDIEERDRRIKEQADEIARHLGTLEDELGVAQDLQIQLLPSEHPEVPGLVLDCRFLPATELCGDYYDFFVLGDDCFDVVIADVTGHGVAPALVALQIRALTQSEASAEIEPAELVGRLNRYAVDNFDKSYLLSMFYLRYRRSDGRVAYVGAGHNPFAVARRDGQVEMYRSKDTLLGIFGDIEFTQSETRLGEGDRLLLYTDGLIEVMDEAEAPWGYDRLKETFLNGRELPGRELLDRLVREATYHGGNKPLMDDVTMVLLERTGGDA